MFLLQLDNSGNPAIAAQKKELAEKIAELQEEISQTQSDRYVELQKNAYDDDLDNYKEQQQDKIDEIEEWLDKEGLVAKEAMRRLNEESDMLYEALIEWNSTYGTGIENDVISKWKSAIEAVKQYGSALKALESTDTDSENYKGISQAMIDKITSDIQSNAQYSGKTETSQALQPSGAPSSESAANIISAMKANSAKWYPGMPEKTAMALHNGNAVLAEELAKVFSKQAGKAVRVLYDNDMGQWYRSDRSSEDEFIYHNGLEEGFVGNSNYNSTQEQYAKLLKGELVANPEQQIDFMKRILPSYTQTAIDRYSVSSGTSIDMSGMKLLTVEGDVTHDTLPELKIALNNAKGEIAQSVLEVLSSGFNKRGHKPSASSVLRRKL